MRSSCSMWILVVAVKHWSTRSHANPFTWVVLRIGPEFVSKETPTRTWVASGLFKFQHLEILRTPSVQKYLSQKCIKMDVSRTKICLDTSISPTSISGRREYNWWSCSPILLQYFFFAVTSCTQSIALTSVQPNARNGPHCLIFSVSIYHNWNNLLKLKQVFLLQVIDGWDSTSSPHNFQKELMGSHLKLLMLHFISPRSSEETDRGFPLKVVAPPQLSLFPLSTCMGGSLP